jgi:16S rRNA (cytosine967-C5)-methyltransferase
LPTLNEVTGQKPREIAARVLGKRRDSDEYTETLLERSLLPTKLSPADRGLTQELVFGVIRWQLTLDWLIERKTQGRTQKPGLQDLLRLGLYQIFWLDRIPDHAAVHETVEQAKRGGYGAQAGFINAVLRGYLREADETRRLLAELKATQPALGYSHPEWLVEKWQQRGESFSPVQPSPLPSATASQVAGYTTTPRPGGRAPTRDAALTQLLEWNNTPPKNYARLNTLNFGKPAAAADERRVRRGVPEKIQEAGDFLTFWRDEGVEYDFFNRDWTGDGLVFELKSHPPLATLESFQKGWFYIQDPSTLLAVRELDPKPGETILDLCAAPGGKTTFIAQLMNNTGRIVAHDNVPDRLKLVTENCQRLGLSSVEIAPALDPRPSTFDRILVDAPCSNTGVLRRRVDLRWRIQPTELERLRATQLDLLQKSAARLKPGGTLVYSTCSLEPEENTELVKQFLAAQPGFKLERERQLLPFADGVDGAYVAKLTRQS